MKKSPKDKAIEELRKIYLRDLNKAEKKEDQIALFEKMHKIAGDAGLPAWVAYAEGAVASLKGNGEKALMAFDKAIELDPSFAYPWNGKGASLYRLKRYGEALKAYDRAIELDPSFAYPWNGKGAALSDLKRYDEALKAFDKAIELDPNFAYPWNGKGYVLRVLNRYGEALKAYDRAIELDPSYASPWHGKGYVLRDLNRYGEAQKAYERAIELDQTYWSPKYNLGLLYWDLEKYEESLAAFREAEKLEVDADWREPLGSWIARVGKALEGKNKGKSKEVIEKADRESVDALVTDLFEALKGDLEDIEEKKKDFKDRMAETVGKKRVVGAGGIDDIFFVLRDWNSFTPLLRKEIRNDRDQVQDERLGGGYFLVWKNHGVVIDPGADFVTQLYRKNLSIADVDTVIVTHCHLDHIRDLETLVDLNYRYNEKLGHKPDSDGFRHIQFSLCDHALDKYGRYLKTSGCCVTPLQLTAKTGTQNISPNIEVSAVGARHRDINGRDDEAIGLVFNLKDEKGKLACKVGITSDSRWFEEFPVGFKGCDVLVSHLGTIEVGEDDGEDDGKRVQKGFLETDLKNHLGAKGCYRMLQKVKPKLFVMGEFGEELVETRLKIVRVFQKLKSPETDAVLGGDSNLAIKLGKKLSVRCTHKHCKDMFCEIPLGELDPQIGDDNLFQYICPKHRSR